MTLHLVRLALYVAAVAGVGGWTLGHDPRWWVALVCALSAAVVGLPAAALSYDGIGRALGWLPPTGLEDDAPDLVPDLDAAA